MAESIRNPIFRGVGRRWHRELENLYHPELVSG